MSWGTTPGQHKAWSLSVKRRDRYQCQGCGYQGAPGRGDVQADHIVNRAKQGTYDLANGQTLCIPCHDAKTRAEHAEGMARRRRTRDPEPHPGRK